MSLFSRKKPKNRYSERKTVSISWELRPARTIRPVNGKSRFSFGSLLGWFSAATVVSICAVVFIAVAVGLIFVYRWSTTSNYFALQEIDVAGLNNLSYTEVLEQAELQSGMNSLALSLDEVETKLIQNPWIKEVSVKRSLPDGLTISIKEREPSYWTLKEGHMHYADQSGKVIAQVNSNKFLALPILEIAPDSIFATKALEYTVNKVHQVLMTLPEEFHNPALYKLSQARGMEIHFENKSLRLLFGFEDIDGNIKRMTLVLNDLKKRGELGYAKEIRAHNGKVWVVI